MSKKMRKIKKQTDGEPFKISACMMVKDESVNIDRCLRSIRNVVDEIVVVDTGSTDNTVEICEKYGAKIFHHTWEDNFSLHRNQSMDYATGDWLLIIDADEELILDNASRAYLRKQLKKVPENIDGVALLFKDIQKGQVVMQFNTTRFFKKDKVKYEGIVHNQPIMSSGKVAAFMENVFINHYGYDLTVEEKEAKTQRTLKLLEKRLENDDTDHLAYFYMMQLFSDNRRYAEAVESGEKYMSLAATANDDKLFMDAIYYCMVRNYIYLEDVEKTKWWLTEGIKALPDDLDLAMGLVEFGSWQRRGDYLVSGANKFIELYEKYEQNSMLRGNRFIYSFTPEGKAFCLFHLSAFNIAQAVNSLNSLKIILDTVKIEYAKGMRKDMQRLITATKLDRISNLFEKESGIISDISALSAVAGGR